MQREKTARLTGAMGETEKKKKKNRRRKRRKRRKRKKTTEGAGEVHQSLEKQKSLLLLPKPCLLEERSDRSTRIDAHASAGFLRDVLEKRDLEKKEHLQRSIARKKKKTYRKKT